MVMMMKRGLGDGDEGGEDRPAQQCYQESVVQLISKSMCGTAGLCYLLCYGQVCIPMMLLGVLVHDLHCSFVQDIINNGDK